MLRSLQLVASVGLIGTILSLAAMPPALAANKVAYIVPGVRDDGGATNTGVATTFVCSNLSSTSINVHLQVRDSGGAVLANASFNLPRKNTYTASTHFTAAFVENAGALTPGTSINQGYATISSSTPGRLVCSAMIVDAASATPDGIALHMQRRSPLPRTLE